MPLDLILFLMIGWLLMTIGVAMAIRSYRESRGLVPEFPRKQHMTWLMRVAFVSYVFLAFGHAALTATQFNLTNPSINSDVRP